MTQGIDPTFRCITFPTSSAVAVTVGIAAGNEFLRADGRWKVFKE